MFRSIILNIAKRIAADPEVQRTAAKTYEQTIKPVVRDAAERAKSNIEFAAKEIQQTAKETDPLKEPGNFAQKIRSRLLEPDKTQHYEEDKKE